MIAERTNELRAVYEKYMIPKKKNKKPRSTAAALPLDSSLSNEKIIDLALKAKNGNLFQCLMTGDDSAHNGDTSAADQAYCNILAFYTKDSKQIKSIFESSGRMRPKCDVIHDPANNRTYLEMTIDKAIVDTLETYNPNYGRVATDKPEGKAKGHPHEKYYPHPDSEYLLNSHGQLCRRKPNKDTGMDDLIPVLEGSAIITEEITKDDGIDPQRYFCIEGVTRKGQILPPAQVLMKNFNGLNWITENWGCLIAPRPEQNAKSCAAHALILSGENAKKRTVYSHTGFEKINGNRVFLHGGGAIGANDIDVELENEKLRRYTFSQAKVTPEAVRASLLMLTAHEPHVTYPLFCLTYLAPLNSLLEEIVHRAPTLAMFLKGETQSGKSTIAALAASHFGVFSSYDAPANFHGTANYLRRLMSLLKDVLLWIDDFHPRGTKLEAQKQNSMMQDIARASGDKAVRGRMNSSRTLEAEMIPKSTYLITGEDLPEITQSGVARIFVLNVNQYRADIRKIQEYAENGTLNAAMRGYIEYILQLVENPAFPTSVNKAYQSSLDDFSKSLGGHSRLTENCTFLLLGAWLFTGYASSVGVFDGVKSKQFMDDCKKYILQAAEVNDKNVKEEDPVKLFIDMIRDRQQAGDLFHRIPPDTPVCNLNADDFHMGWCDSDYYYTPAAQCEKVLKRHYDDRGGYFPIRYKELFRRLQKQGIAESDSSGNYTKPKKINGTNRRVMFLVRNKIDENSQTSTEVN